jgi:hypothetical protein
LLRRTVVRERIQKKGAMKHAENGFYTTTDSHPPDRFERYPAPPATLISAAGRRKPSMKSLIHRHAI